jgi:hypothetical protein
MRTLVAFEPVEGMRRDIAAAKREREDTAERAEDALDRPEREPVRLQLVHDRYHIVGCDQRQPAATEPGQLVTTELRAVEIERPIAALTRCDLRLELGEPASRYPGEGESGRDVQLADAGDALEQFALTTRLGKRSRIDGAETRPPLDHHADRVPSVRLLVDPTLDAHASASTAARHAGSSVRGLGSGENEPRVRRARLLERK